MPGNFISDADVLMKVDSFITCLVLLQLGHHIHDLLLPLLVGLVRGSTRPLVLIKHDSIQIIVFSL